ncbi:hypothetical protein [Kingella oralis]|nr:hypothetical protein [Kingella oralis]
MQLACLALCRLNKGSLKNGMGVSGCLDAWQQRQLVQSQRQPENILPI